MDVRPMTADREAGSAGLTDQKPMESLQGSVVEPSVKVGLQVVYTMKIVRNKGAKAAIQWYL